MESAFRYFLTPMIVLQTTELSKTYTSGVFRPSSIPALRDITLSVEQGQIFGLLGPNGAGKTTFIKLLLNIALPTSGTGTVLGHPLGSRLIRQHVGYLPENHRYPSFLTAFQTLIHFGRLQGLSGTDLTARAKQLLDTTGLAEWANTRIRKFSKGMMQRMGLAQALLADPPILFLDEPTDGVDPLGRKEIRDVLIELRSRGKTVFLNSHMLSEVEEVSDRVAILNKGRLLHVGTVRDITTGGLRYEIRLGAAPSQAIVDALRPLCSTIDVVDTSIRAAFNSPADSQKALDILRGASLAIQSFSPQTARLEDFFLQLLRKETP